MPTAWGVHCCRGDAASDQRQPVARLLRKAAPTEELAIVGDTIASPPRIVPVQVATMVAPSAASIRIHIQHGTRKFTSSGLLPIRHCAVSGCRVGCGDRAGTGFSTGRSRRHALGHATVVAAAVGWHWLVAGVAWRRLCAQPPAEWKPGS